MWYNHTGETIDKHAQKDSATSISDINLGERSPAILHVHDSCKVTPVCGYHGMACCERERDRWREAEPSNS